MVSGSVAWTCPEEDTDSTVCRANQTDSTNTIGQSIYTTFSVQYKILHDKDSVSRAYRTFQFDDALVEQHVRALAKQNSKVTPQTYTLRQILDADENNLLIVDKPSLNEELFAIGYELYDVVT
eukprot:UN04731